ncbi:hypothetical protein AALA78_13030 [Lachnospiraceae bacterium 42-17]|jgi:hypothetical protein|nr:hypothetical protein [Dorea sp.]
MNPNYWQMPEDSTELKKGMSYDTELVRGMIYEDEPKVVAVKEENLQRGMRYLPEECAALAEEVCESISSDKNANVIKNIFAPLLAEGLAQYGEQTSAKANILRNVPRQKAMVPSFIPLQTKSLNFSLTLQRRVREITDTETGEQVKESYSVLVTVFARKGAVKQMQAIVEADKIKQTEWLKRCTNSLATLPRNKDQKEDFDMLVQECIEEDFVPEEIIYPNAGWRNIYNKGWRYVYSNGVVGENNAFIHTNSNDKYILNISQEKIGSAEVFQMAMNMSNVCKDKRASTELVLFTHATVLNTLFEQAGYMLNFVFGISGVTNSRKTSMVLALAKLFDRERLFADAEFATATNCGIEKMLGLYKDAPVLVDDFKPGSTRREQQIMDKKLDELVRLYGNRVPKKRMLDFSASKEHTHFPIGGGCILTMEIITGVTSSISRMFLTELQIDSVDNNLLQFYQENRWILPTYFYDFIFWLTGHFEEIVSFIHKAYPQQRGYIRVSVPRYAEMYATLRISAILIGKYAQERGFWREEEAASFIKSVDEILTCEISNMEMRIMYRDKATLLIDVLRDALEKGILVPQVLSPENCSRMYTVYENDNYLFIQTKELRRLIDGYCRSYGERIEIVNDDEIFGLLERLGALEILEKSDGKRERSRKLPNPKGNTKRYLYIRKEAISKVED